MEQLGEKVGNAVAEIKSLESELEHEHTTHEIEISITESSRIIYSLCNGIASTKKDVLKLPIKDALEFYYLNQLKKLNEMEAKISELQLQVELKRKNAHG